MKRLTLLLVSVVGVAVAAFFMRDYIDPPLITKPPRDINEIRARVTPQLRAEFAAKGLEYGAPVFMRIFKEERVLELWVQKDLQFELFKTYGICNYSGQLGPKLREGDWQSPEGFYFVPPSAMNPNSSYHLSFNLGFPNKFDREAGRTGSFLMVHGDCVSIGCYAMTDEQIEEIYVIAEAAHSAGQPYFRVHAFPFRMDAERMAKEQDSEWFAFWQNLKQGYDAFEKSYIPPDVKVKDGLYVFDTDSG